VGGAREIHLSSSCQHRHWRLVHRLPRTKLAHVRRRRTSAIDGGVASVCRSREVKVETTLRMLDSAILRSDLGTALITVDGPCHRSGY